MPTPKLVFSIAKRHHQAKRHREAEALYKSLLDTEGFQESAAAQLGQLALDMKATQKALDIFGHLNTVHPDQPQHLRDLGIAYTQNNDFDQAMLCLSRSLFLNPNDEDAIFAMSNLMLQQQQNDSAISYLKQLLQINPSHAQGYKKLGSAFFQHEDYAQAALFFERASELDEDDWEAYSFGALTLLLLDKPKLAKENLEIALLLSPGNPDALTHLATVEMTLGNYHAAILNLNQVIPLVPQSPTLQMKIATAYYQLGDLSNAITHGCKAIAIDAHFTPGHQILGLAYFQQGDHLLALHSFEAIVNASSYSADTIQQSSRALLAMGETKTAFKLMQKFLAALPDRFEMPPWSDADLSNKRIFVYSLLGVPDALFEASRLKQKLPTNTQIILEAPYHVAPILAQLRAIDNVWNGKGTLEFEANAPMESIIASDDLLPTNIDVPLLCPPSQETLQKWVAALPQTTKPKIGILWRHESDSIFDYYRSVRLEEFAPLFEQDELKIISLQYNAGLEELDAFPYQSHLLHPSLEPTNMEEWMSLAQTLDLVICADTLLGTAVACSGHPVWLLAPQRAPWYLGQKGKQSPWLPGTTIFRQQQLGQWSAVIEEVIAAVTPFTENFYQGIKK